MVQEIKAFADRYVEKFISRKFLAWCVATALALYGVLESEHWVWVTVSYLGTQAAIDAVVALKSAA
jgi:hypothetical protein|tara:strand:- start:356 stop:553 length:198 start_codon:yes stop_codon:yes gene_type:complete